MRRHDSPSPRHRSIELLGLLVIMAVVAGCSDKKQSNLLAELLGAQAEAQAHAVEGYRFRISVPPTLQAQRGRDQHGISVVRFVHPQGTPDTVPSIMVGTQTKAFPFPTDEASARTQLQQPDVTLEAVERAGAGWLAVSKAAGSTGVHVHAMYDADARSLLTCQADFKGPRSDDALTLMKNVCGSLEYEPRGP